MIGLDRYRRLKPRSLAGVEAEIARMREFSVQIVEEAVAFLEPGGSAKAGPNRRRHEALAAHVLAEYLKDMVNPPVELLCAVAGVLPHRNKAVAPIVEGTLKSFFGGSRSRCAKRERLLESIRRLRRTSAQARRLLEIVG